MKKERDGLCEYYEYCEVWEEYMRNFPLAENFMYTIEIQHYADEDVPMMFTRNVNNIRKNEIKDIVFVFGCPKSADEIFRKTYKKILW